MWEIIGWIFIVYFTCVFICVLKTSENEKVKLLQCFNPIKWVSYVFGVSLIKIIPLHILEQLVLRVYDPECRECVRQGSCIDCGCDIPAKMYVPYEKCSRNNWGPMILSKKKYKEHRKEVPVAIKVEYGVEYNDTALSGTGNIENHDLTTKG